jgi:hypothetical protein
MNSVKRSNFDENIRGGRELAVYKFKVAKRREEGGSTALFFVPACA